MEAQEIWLAVLSGSELNHPFDSLIIHLVGSKKVRHSLVYSSQHIFTTANNSNNFFITNFDFKVHFPIQRKKEN
jgi:hypothetical protein